MPPWSVRLWSATLVVMRVAGRRCRSPVLPATAAKLGRCRGLSVERSPVASGAIGATVKLRAVSILVDIDPELRRCLATAAAAAAPAMHEAYFARSFALAVNSVSLKNVQNSSYP